MMDVYGFAHESLDAARMAVEEVLSIHLDEIRENPPRGRHFRGCVPSGPWVQIQSNSGACKWSPPWHPTYGILIFVHGKARESIAQRLRSVPGLQFLESKLMMDDYRPSQR